MNSDLNIQAQTLEVTFSRKIKSYHSQACFNNILRIYLNEKLNFYLIFLLILKYNGNHQYNTQQTEMLQYFIAEQTFKYLHFLSTITDTSHPINYNTS